MQIEIEIDDKLLAEARAIAEREGTTLDALVEEGLMAVLAEDGSSPNQKYEMVTRSVHGHRRNLLDQGRS